MAGAIVIHLVLQIGWELCFPAMNKRRRFLDFLLHVFFLFLVVAVVFAAGKISYYLLIGMGAPGVSKITGSNGEKREE